MKVLDLFSGIGGFSLGLHRAGMTTVAFCEIEPYPQAVLRKNFPGVPIYDDVRTITAERLAADGIDTIDLICGGFPCQPFSVAGQQRGTADHRHLWPEMYRIIKECKPTWVIGENVAGFIDMALSEVCADLESAGYEVQPFVIPACAVNAPHRRDRVWIVAHSYCNSKSWCANDEQRETSGPMVFANPRLQRQEISQEQTARVEPTSDAGNPDSQQHKSRCNAIGRQATTDIFADHDGNRLHRAEGYEAEPRGDRAQDRLSFGDGAEVNGYTDGAGCEEQHTPCFAAKQGQHTGELIATGPDWSAESPFCGVADGIPRRVDRLKCLGNAVVPQIPEIIGRAIMGIWGGR